MSEAVHRQRKTVTANASLRGRRVGGKTVLHFAARELLELGAS
jgi:hypothetical protein